MSDDATQVDETTTDTGAEATQEQTPAAPDFGVMPMWNDFLEVLPEAWAEQAKGLIGKSEAQLQQELQKRASRSPEIDADYLDLYKEAQAAGVPAAELERAYNESVDMRQQIVEDPAGFVSSMAAAIQEQIDAGALTLKEGTKLLAQVEKAADDAVELDMSPAERRIAELEKREQQREARAAQQEEQQTRQQQEQERQEFVKYANEFTAAIDNAFLANVANEAGEHAASVPARKAFATLAAQYADDALHSGQPISNEQAIELALNDLGGWESLRPKGRPGIPVGGSRGVPQPADLQDLPVEERMKAAVELAKSMTAS